MADNGRTSYHTYICYYNNTLAVNMLKDKYLNILRGHKGLLSLYSLSVNREFSENADNLFISSFQTRDLSNLPMEAKMEFVSSYVTSQRQQIYDSEVTYPTNIQIYDWGKQEYICIIGYCELMGEYISEDEFLRGLGIKIYNPSVEKFLPEKSMAYYAKLFSNNYTSIASGTELLRQNQISEFFEIDKRVTDIIKNREAGDTKKVKNILVSLWDMVLAKTFKLNSIVSADSSIHSKPLPIAFNVHDVSKGFDSFVVDTTNIYKIYENYSDCTIDELEMVVGRPLKDYVSCLHDFSMFNDRVKIRDMSAGYALELNPLSDIQVPLKMIYQYMDGQIIAECIYDQEIFKDVSMSDLHKTVMDLLYSIVSKAFLAGTSANIVTPVVEGVKKEEDANKKRIFNTNLSVINKCEIFSVCTDEEKRMLAEKSVIRPYSIGEVVVKSDVRYDMVRLLAVGKISAERLDREGCIKPLMLIKEGNFFAIESLYEPYSSKDMYTVSSNQAFIMSIPTETIKKLYKVHPEILIDFMKMMGSTTEKFKKLWMLS